MALSTVSAAPLVKPQYGVRAPKPPKATVRKGGRKGK